jgi:hypothetical protein
MKATCTFKTSTDFQQTTWHYMPEDTTLHKHHCENLKSCYLASTYGKSGMLATRICQLNNKSCRLKTQTRSNMFSV